MVVCLVIFFLFYLKLICYQKFKLETFKVQGSNQNEMEKKMLFCRLFFQWKLNDLIKLNDFQIVTEEWNT